MDKILALPARFAALLLFAAVTLLLAAPPASAKQGWGEGCSAFKPCGDGLSCQPFVQKCYHKPRHRDEPCSAGFGCGPGLSCMAGKQVCVGPGKLGDSCHLTKPCGEGLTCMAGKQVCVGPAKLGESCHLTKPCGTGLTCMPGSQVCAAPAKPIAMPGDFPPPAAAKSSAQRLAECEADKTPECYAKVSTTLTAGVPSNCLYGWAVGKSHPSNNDKPPSYDKLLNAIDQCAWFHDRGAWRYNRNTKICEHWTMCSNSLGLMRCLDRYKPKNQAEADAKACFTENFRTPIKACVPKLYADWGAEYATDGKGEQWLSAKSVGELRGAMKQCPGNMNSPGFEGFPGR